MKWVEFTEGYHYVDETSRWGLRTRATVKPVVEWQNPMYRRYVVFVMHVRYGPYFEDVVEAKQYAETVYALLPDENRNQRGGTPPWQTSSQGPR